MKRQKVNYYGNITYYALVFLKDYFIDKITIDDCQNVFNNIRKKEKII